MNAKTPLLRTSIVLAALMFAATALAVVLRPTIRLAEQGPKFDLETLVPKTFGEWRIDDSLPLILPAPDVQAAIDKIYNQTLARSYINSRGQRIMLSIAYGGDQSDSFKLHRPEGCYAGQGFQIVNNTTSRLTTASSAFPVVNLVARLNRRNEPITYWMVIGDQVALSDFEIKKVKLRYALRGEIPDGILIRISSLFVDEQEAYEVHREFTDALVKAISPENRWRLIGAG